MNALDIDTPLCPVHMALDERGHLEVVYGNNCVACSLNERQELLDILASAYSTEDRPSESLEALRTLITERDAKEATLMAVVHIVGGLVEGQPTNRANFLQRIRELRRIERR